MDPLKNLSNQLGGKIQFQDIVDINFKEIAHRRLLIKDYKGIKIEIIDYNVLYSIGIKIESDYFYSINNPEKVLLMKHLIHFSGFTYNIYVKDEHNNPFLKDRFLQFWKEFSYKIIALNLSSVESIFMYKNGMILALSPERELISIIDDYITLVKSHHEIFKKKQQKILSKNIPVNLKHLLPLIKKWAVTDDAERDELIEKTSEIQKRRLIKVVNPYLNEINIFLNSFNSNPLTYEATLIGELAELVCELKLEQR